MMPVKRKRILERSELQDRLESLTRRVEVLEGKRDNYAPFGMDAAVTLDFEGPVTISGRLKAAAARGAQGFTYGRRVAYYRHFGDMRWAHTGWVLATTTWRGTVIPRPCHPECWEFGNTGERLVWVLTDGGQIRGCYAENLCFV